MNAFSRRFYNLYIISYYTGYIILGIAFLMLLPILTAVGLQEWNPFWDFVLTLAISIILGLLLIIIGRETRFNKSFVQWKHGFVVASLSWIILMFLCSIPYLLSGHVNSLLDACFDVMSGFTTTGVALTQDLDHISLSLNLWRHILTFVGGQGMIVLALTFLLKETSGAYIFYVGEAKDIDLVPSVTGTARIIWKISLAYLIIGTAALWLNGIAIGLAPLPAFFNGLFIFSSSWSTGGFAPYSQNMMYYHSFSYETLTILFFILGSLNFGLHYAVLTGNKKELIKNVETQSFFATSLLASILAVMWLARTGIYSNAIAMFRRVVYNILSAHTTTGFGSIYAQQFANQWGDFGIMILVIIMLIGGSACSTAGGMKGLRVSIIFNSIIADIKHLLASERNIKVFRFHHIKNHILSDSLIKSSALIIICYLIIFFIGTLLGTYYGYPMSSAAFESASITGNVGLSIGITSPDMPAALKVYYIIAMYLGRLEFLSVFALIGYIIGGVKKCVTK